MAILVPGCRAGEQDLDDDAGEVDVAEGAAVDGQGAGGGEDKEDDCGDGGAAKVHDAVGEPGEDVEDDVLLCGEDVGEVRAVEDVFEGGEDADPDAGAGFAGDEAGGVSWWLLLGESGKGWGSGLPSGEEEGDPGQHWQCRNEELARNRNNRRHSRQQHNARLNHRRGRRNRRREEQYKDQKDVLRIIKTPSSLLQLMQRHVGREGRLDGGERRGGGLARVQL